LPFSKDVGVMYSKDSLVENAGFSAAWWRCRENGHYRLRPAAPYTGSLALSKHKKIDISSLLNLVSQMFHSFIETFLSMKKWQIVFQIPLKTMKRKSISKCFHMLVYMCIFC
jgi:hypothetical protein